MTSFLIATNVTDIIAKTLNGFETGVVAPGALLAVTNGTAITMIGSTPYLTVLGTVHNATGPRAVGNDGATITALPNINVGAEGAIIAPAGDGIGLTYSGNNFLLQNNGLISGNVAVRLAGSATSSQAANIVNNGTMSSATSGIITNNLIDSLTLTNTGIIQAGIGRAVQLGSTGALVITNSGTILSTSVALESFGNLQLRNTGTILGDVRFNTIGSVQNSGLIEGDITDGDMDNSPGFSGMVVRNAGTVTGDVNLGNGNDFYIDLGGSVGGTVFGGAGVDTYYINDASIRINDGLGFGDQILTTVDYRIVRGIEILSSNSLNGLQLWGNAQAQTINGGVGDDTIEGGGGDDSLSGRGGEDVLYGGRGNDLFTDFGPSSGILVEFFGGDGDDRFNWSGASGTLKGGLGRDVVDIDAIPGFVGDIDLQTGVANLVDAATGLVVSTVTLNQIESAWGSNGNDSLDGSDLDNTLDGIGGNDSLVGFAGNDEIFGGAGVDTLVGATGEDALYGGDGNDDLFGSDGNDLMNGGLGRDTLTGGSGVDSFNFLAFQDSAVGTPDRVVGFDVLTERINLSVIDANLAVTGDDAFAFNGIGAFVGTGAQVRYFHTGGNLTTVQVRLAGDAITDMEIILSGQLTLTVDNFHL